MGTAIVLPVLPVPVPDPLPRTPGSGGFYYTSITPNTPRAFFHQDPVEQPDPDFLTQLSLLGMEKGVPPCSPLAIQLLISGAHVTSMVGVNKLG